MSEHPATTTKGEVLLVLYKYVKVYFLHLSPQPTGPNLCPAMAGCVDQSPNMQVTLTPCSPCRSSLRILPRCPPLQNAAADRPNPCPAMAGCNEMSSTLDPSHCRLILKWQPSSIAEINVFRWAPDLQRKRQMWLQSMCQDSEKQRTNGQKIVRNGYLTGLGYVNQSLSPTLQKWHFLMGVKIFSRSAASLLPLS